MRITQTYAIRSLIATVIIPVALLLAGSASSAHAKAPKRPSARTSVTVSAPSGWMNRSLMVRTSQGVMHRDAAIRLGLPYQPF